MSFNGCQCDNACPQCFFLFLRRAFLKQHKHLHDPFSCVTYAVEKRLTNSPEWEWTRDFMSDTKQYQRLINTVKTTKSMGPKYKFGVEIPRSVKHALELDRRNGNNLWKEALLKELAQLDEFQVF